MPTTQPAVVNFSAQKGAVELRQVPVPDIGPDDVLLEVQAVGVCGSDLHMWQFCQSWPVESKRVCIWATTKPKRVGMPKMRASASASCAG